MKETMWVVAITVEPKSITLYSRDGNTLIIKQGDLRVPGIVDTCQKNSHQLTQGNAVEVDITLVVNTKPEYGAMEKGSNGVVRFFRMAKAKLQEFLGAEEVPKSAPTISPLQIGKIPGIKDTSLVTPEFATSTTVPSWKKDGVAEVVDMGTEVTVPIPTKPVSITELIPVKSQEEIDRENTLKLASTQRKMDTIMGMGTGTDKPSFHTPLTPEETIVAIHTGTGTVMPDAQNTAPQLRAAMEMNQYKGYQNLLARLENIDPSTRTHSIQDLVNFIKHTDMPICDDGSILVYKRLTTERDGWYYDLHSNRVPQRVGTFVYMDSTLVDTNRREACSNGLHVGALKYVHNFGSGDVFITLVRPEDVFAVPQYDTTKMRVSGYHLVHKLSHRLQSIMNSNKSIMTDEEGRQIISALMAGNIPPVDTMVHIGGQRGTNVSVTHVTGDNAEPISTKATTPSVQVNDTHFECEPAMEQAPTVTVDAVLEVQKIKPADPKPEKPTVVRKPKQGSKTARRKAAKAKKAPKTTLTESIAAKVKSEAKRAPVVKAPKAAVKPLGTPRELITAILSKSGELSAIDKIDAQYQRKRAKKSYAAMGFTPEQIKRLG